MANTRAILVAVLLTVSAGWLHAADALTSDQKEEFLRKAKIVQTKQAAKGVTGTLRVTLSDGKITHDASVQRINESHAVYQTPDGHTELELQRQLRVQHRRLEGCKDVGARGYGAAFGRADLPRAERRFLHLVDRRRNDGRD